MVREGKEKKDDQNRAFITKLLLGLML